MASKDFLISVFEDTKRLCTEGKFRSLPHAPSVKYRREDLNFCPAREEKEEEKERGKKCTTVSVVNRDTLLVCQEEWKEGEKLCMLNMASSFKPGGGVRTGAMAQEEELCRRTNLLSSLPSSFYPLQDDIIFTPHISIIKTPSYVEVDDVITVSCISAAALRKPQLNNGKYKKEDREYMTRLIENIFLTAAKHEVDVLVLGALGCGAYANPQDEVIRIFNQMLKKYDGVFSRVIFAVLSRRDPNFTLFSRGINT
jgi:uncharacterized protein (TIGR02452 family)